MRKLLVIVVMVGVVGGAVAVAMLAGRDTPSTGSVSPVQASLIPVEAAPAEAGSASGRSLSPVEVSPEPGGDEPAATTGPAVQVDMGEGPGEGSHSSSSGSVATGVAPSEGSVTAPQVTDPTATGGSDTAEAAFEAASAADGADPDTADGSTPARAAARVVDKGDPSGADPSQAGDGNAFTRDDEPPSKEGEEEFPVAPEPGPAVPGRVYTWQDGDRTRQVRLNVELAVVEDVSAVAEDDIVARSGSRSIIHIGRRKATASDETEPVFRSESGILMSLPGGVVLILDPDWSTSEVQTFFADNSISLDRVSDLGELPNAFTVETKPGFPSLELANALAGQVGVVVSSPNWWMQAVTK